MEKNTILIFVFVIVLGVGSYFFLFKKDEPQPTTGGTPNTNAGTPTNSTWTPTAEMRTAMTQLSAQVGDWTNDPSSIEWGPISQVVRTKFGEEPETNAMINLVVLGFLKGFDIAPKGWAVELASQYIAEYIAKGGRTEPLVKEGEYLAV